MSKTHDEPSNDESICEAEPAAKVTAEDYAELWECSIWLESPQATSVRGKCHIDGDRQAVKSLLVQPPKAKQIDLAGKILEVKRKNQTYPMWHARCAKELICRYRTWRQGGIANMLRRRGAPLNGSPRSWL